MAKFRNVQSKGSEYIFKDYNLRIAQVVRDYGMFDSKKRQQIVNIIINRRAVDDNNESDIV
ncbi:hypothetical protein [Ferruginibacter sp.]|nr:hypothetical protein [Ferruginibacter sp.]